jgi:hypothetical protein
VHALTAAMSVTAAAAAPRAIESDHFAGQIAVGGRRVKIVMLSKNDEALEIFFRITEDGVLSTSRAGRGPLLGLSP